MRWEDERYIRVFTRDTPDWMALGYDAQCLFMQLLRKVDRAGILPIGKHGKKSVAIVLGQVVLWESRIAPALDVLLEDGCVVMDSDKLVIRNFIEAQECRASDALRSKEKRERARELGKSEKVGTVYFVRSENGGPIKIGFAVDLKSRISNLQTGRPDKLCVLHVQGGTEDDEKKLHEKFNAHSINGEWFHPGEDLIEYIATRAVAEDTRAVAQATQVDTSRHQATRSDTPSVPSVPSVPSGSDSSELSRTKPTEPTEPVLIEFPCAKGETWHLTETIRREMAEAYPAVDVLACARKALEWLRSHPRNLKTRPRMRGWIGSVWCGRQQDKQTALPIAAKPETLRWHTATDTP
jgi:hypothetical protein